MEMGVVKHWKELKDEACLRWDMSLTHCNVIVNMLRRRIIIIVVIVILVIKVILFVTIDGIFQISFRILLGLLLLVKLMQNIIVETHSQMKTAWKSRHCINHVNTYLLLVLLFFLLILRFLLLLFL